MTATSGHPEEPLAVLLVESDAGAAAFLGDQLAIDGYEPRVARDHRHALALMAQRPPDLVVLGDLEDRREALALLADVRAGAGGETCRLDVPIVVLTRHRGELDALRCFAAGADDVVGRPYSYPELRARLAALLRRSRGRPERHLLRVGTLELDTRAHAVRVAGKTVALCRREYELLAHLAADPHRVFTKHELLRDVWGFRCEGVTRTLDSHACRLRRKLAAAAGAQYVANVWGVGYCLVRPPVSVGASASASAPRAARA